MTGVLRKIAGLSLGYLVKLSSCPRAHLFSAKRRLHWSLRRQYHGRQQSPVRHEIRTMDRTRPLRLDHPLSASSSTSSTSSVSRPKPASAPKDPVKRKPLPGATSSPTAGPKPPLDSSSAPEEPSRSHSIFQQPLPTIPQIPNASPIIVPRDLDQ